MYKCTYICLYMCIYIVCRNYATPEFGSNHTRRGGDPKGRLKPAQTRRGLDGTVNAHARRSVHVRVATTPAIHRLDPCGSADPGRSERSGP